MHHSVRSSRNYSWLWCGHIFLHGELCTIHLHSSCVSWWVSMAAAFKNQSIRLPSLYLISHLNQIRCCHSLLKEIVQAWQLPQASSKLWHRCKPSSSALDFFIHIISSLCFWGNSFWIYVEQLSSTSWEELVPMTKLKPGYSESCHNYLNVTYPHRVTHIRLNIYPGNTPWIIQCNLKKMTKQRMWSFIIKKMAQGEMLQRSSVLESHLFCKMNTNEGL